MHLQSFIQGYKSAYFETNVTILHKINGKQELRKEKVHLPVGDATNGFLNWSKRLAKLKHT
jgi:hypothetical protein